MAIPIHRQEHLFIEKYGRQYGIDYIQYRLTNTPKMNSYLLPVDSTERDRLDVMHTLLKSARPPTKQLTDVPTEILRKQPPHVADVDCRPRVMDVGCGTGLWLLQMAEEFPDAVYDGYDINYVLPETLMDNIVPHIPFMVETPWNIGSHDFIHVQLMLGSICNWNYLISNIRRNLTPGGWFENVEIDWEPRCDDGMMNTNPLQPGLMQWWTRVSHAYRVLNCSLDYHQDIEGELKACDFRDIRHETYRIPLCGWHTTDASLHRVGSWWNIAMSQGRPDEGCFGLEAMSMRPILETERAWTSDMVRQLCSEAMKEASNIQVKAYNVLHIVTARAPLEDGT